MKFYRYLKVDGSQEFKAAVAWVAKYVAPAYNILEKTIIISGYINMA